MQFPLHAPFVAHLGFELLRSASGEAEVQCVLKPELLNTWQVAHGGVIMTLLDVCMANAARSSVGDAGQASPGLATLEMKTQFMRPGEGHLVAQSRLLHRTATLAFTEGRVYNRRADGNLSELIAHATGTFKFLTALPTSLRTVSARQVNSC